MDGGAVEGNQEGAAALNAMPFREVCKPEGSTPKAQDTTFTVTRGPPTKGALCPTAAAHKEAEEVGATDGTQRGGVGKQEKGEGVYPEAPLHRQQEGEGVPK